MRAHRLLLVALVTALALHVAADGRRRAVRVPASGLEIHPLAGYDPKIATHDDLAPFGAIVGDATVVGLGESWHLSGGFYALKHRLFRYLVEEKGFRAFAMETNWEAVERTNAYVQTCSGTAENAIRDEHPYWQSSEYADLVRWMCEWNRSHPAAEDRLTIFGMDIQQPERDGPALETFLGQLGVPQSDPRVQGLRSCEMVFGLSHPFGEIPPAVHATCLAALDGIEAYLQTNRSTIVQRTSENAFAIAMLRVVGLRANQEQVFWIRDHFAKGFNYRDVGMAYAFHLRRAQLAPNAKTAVWVAAVHVAENELPGGELPFGSHLKAALGDGYASFALAAYETEVPRTPGVCALTARKPGSAEERLMSYGLQTLLARPINGVPHYEAMPVGFFNFRPFADFDGIVFLARSPAMDPLLYPGCR